MRRHCKRILDQFRNGEAFTNLYTGVSTTKPLQKKCRLKRRLRSIYTKIAAQPLLQNIADKLENEFKKIQMKETQVAKMRAEITWELALHCFVKVIAKSTENKF